MVVTIWIARRVPDDAYVTNPNQLGIDHYEFENPDDYLASPDIRNFINKHHLDLTYSNEHFNPRYAFGSQRDKDRHYNTTTRLAMQKFLNQKKTMIKIILYSMVPKTIPQNYS